MNTDPEIITIIDDDGNELSFEELDRIETDDGKRYVAVVPFSEDDTDEDEVELIFLRVTTEDDNAYLEPIEDEDEFNEIAEIFTERLSEFYDIQ